jgi:hypothetical protein
MAALCEWIEFDRLGRPRGPTEDDDGTCLGAPAVLARGLEGVRASRGTGLASANAGRGSAWLVDMVEFGFSAAEEEEEEKKDAGKEDRRCDGVLKEGRAL